jgi:hypothetical protein
LEDVVSNAARAAMSFHYGGWPIYAMYLPDVAQ